MESFSSPHAGFEGKSAFMKALWRKVLVPLAAAAIVIAAIGALSSSEPKHEGKRLSEWLRELPSVGSGEGMRGAPARFALHNIGTNAIPHLIKQLRARDSEWKTDVVHWLNDKCGINYLSSLADARRERAVNGFFALGRVAEPAIPQLQALITGADKEDAYYAFNALGAIGSPETMPVFLHAVTNEDAIIRESAVFTIGNFRSRAGAAVPLLAKSLEADERNVRANAANAIAQIGMDPQSAVPALIHALSDNSSMVQRCAILALSVYGRDAIAALPKIKEFAESSDEELRRVARLASVRVQCEMRDGAIVRGPVETKRIALVFTAHEFAEGAETILAALAEREARASFFLTGVFLTNSVFTNLVQEMQQERHYLGPHSDQHLLYCSWDGGRTNLVTEDEFRKDLFSNSEKIPQSNYGYRRFARYFLPPFEHYNRDVADWSRTCGWTLINYTPGTRSNADYTGENDKNFVPSQKIYDSILQREQEDPHGLNGYILLLHLGAGPGRADKFHVMFPKLLDALAAKGYEFVRVDELLRPPRDPNFRGPYGPGFR